MMRKKINDEVLNRFLIDGKRYVQKSEDVPKKYKGFSGDLHIIRIKSSGKIIRTTNLCDSNFAVEAEFVNAEFVDEDGNVIHKRSSYDEERL